MPALGAHGIDVNNPVHRAGRDIHAISTHACGWDPRSLAYARWAIDLPAESPFCKRGRSEYLKTTRVGSSIPASRLCHETAGC